MRLSRCIPLLIAGSFILAWGAHGQCGPRVLPGQPVVGVGNGGILRAIAWDPDGPGPNPAVLVVAGQFSVAGTTPICNIAIWDGTSWSTLGPGLAGLDSVVYDVTIAPDNSLIAVGQFANAGPVVVNNVARWDGSAWTTFGQGLPIFAGSSINAVAALPDGTLVVGGNFAQRTGVPGNSIAAWNGSSWTALGSGLNGPVASLTVGHDGMVYAAGNFTASGSLALTHVARWDGSAWSPLAAGLNGSPSRIITASDGSIIACGGFTKSGATSLAGVGRWDGSAWLPFGNGLSVSVGDITQLPNGHLVAIGELLTRGAAEWDGQQWNSMGWLTPGPTRVATLPDGSPLTSSTFAPSQRWDGSGWRPYFQGPGLASTVTFMAGLPDGSCLVSADYLPAGAITPQHVSRVVNQTWMPLAAGLPACSAAATSSTGAVVLACSDQSVKVVQNGVATSIGSSSNGLLEAVAVRPNGNIIAAGSFLMPDGSRTKNIGEWNGSAWSNIGAGLPSLPTSLLVLSNGDVLAGLLGGVERWNGSSWSFLGSSFSGRVTVLAQSPDGDLYAAGIFSTVGGVPFNNIARWDGSAWAPLGSGLTRSSSPNVQALTFMAEGSLVAGGRFDTAGGMPAASIARWDGTSWHALDHFVLNGSVTSLVQLASGDLAVGGAFTLVNGVASPYFARYRTRCNADFNNDGFTDIFDFGDFIRCFEDGNCPLGEDADYNADGFADVFDFIDFLNDFENAR